MITAWDDYFIHQTPEPIVAPRQEDRGWTDRFWWGALSSDAQNYIAVSMGQYRESMRMDAIVYFIRDGEHRVLKLARDLTPDDYVRPHIGPLGFDIVEPLERWTWRLADNPMGVTWDLDFEAFRPPVEFAQFKFDGPGMGSDYRHMTQTGNSRGSVVVDGGTIELAAPLLTIRDRSWGFRAARDRLGMFIWIQHSFQSEDVFLIYNERRDGSVSYLDGAVTDGDGQHRIVEVGHDLDLGPGRDVRGGTVEIRDERGVTRRVDHTRVLKAYPGPVGYGGWAGRDHSAELRPADGYRYDVSTVDLSRDPADIIAAAPIHIYEHPSRIWLDGAQETVGIFSGGMTRSQSFEYKKRELS